MKKLSVLLLICGLLGCVSSSEYYVPKRDAVIEQKSGKYTFAGEFLNVTRNDTIRAYVHSPGNVIKTVDFVGTYHLELPYRDYYVIYFVNKYGTAKKIAVYNCGEKGFFYYTDIGFGGSESLILLRNNPYMPIDNIILNDAVSLKYSAVIN